VRVLGNLPSFFTRNNADNFNHARMREFLALKKDADVRSLDGKFDPARFFCLVGTNARDYDAAGGLSRAAARRRPVRSNSCEARSGAPRPWSRAARARSRTHTHSRREPRQGRRRAAWAMLRTGSRAGATSS
jgi:hypothetical protein